MREQIGVLGLGQCGGNIASLLESKGYTSVYVNTSIEDLNSIKGVHKIHIPHSEGAAKNRKKVLELATDSFGDIIQNITDILTQKYILVIFSASGGTGSGLSTPTLRYLSQIGKVCVPVAVIPDEDKEYAKSSENAFNLFVEIMNIQNLGATFLLDNSREDKLTINQRFTNEFDAFININNSSALGNIDVAERKQMLSCPGVAVLSKLSKAKSSASEVVDSLHNGIYAKIESKSAKYLAISRSNRSLSIESIVKEIGFVYDVFSGVSDATTVTMISGLQWPQKRIMQFKNRFEETVKNMQEDNFIQLEPLRGLSFEKAQPTSNPPVNPRDLLLGLLK